MLDTDLKYVTSFVGWEQSCTDTWPVNSSKQVLRKVIWDVARCYPSRQRMLMLLPELSTLVW